jgi:hypothetical protein
MDFDRFPYLHHNADGIPADGWQLDGYDYSSEQLEPGDTLRVTLDRETQTGSTPSLQLVSPAAVRDDDVPPLAEAALSPGSSTIDLVIPPDAGPGLFLVRLNGGPDETAIYLRPTWVSAIETGPGRSELAAFASGALALYEVEFTQATPDRLHLAFTWSASTAVAANYGLNLRLTDPAGNEWARLDTQPGYGFLPTSLWPEGRLVHDRLGLSLPPGTPPGDGYTLSIALYQVSTWESVGEYTRTIALDLPTLRPDAPIIASFGGGPALGRLEVPEQVRQGEALRLTAYWLAAEPQPFDYVAEWRLEKESPPTTISATLPLAIGSPPTSWPAGAWIAGRAAIPIPPTTTPGEYGLSLTLYEPGGASTATYTHPGPVRVDAPERVYDLPTMEHPVNARFGDDPGGTMELAGYDLEQVGEALHLTLHWRALTAPEQHYALFVHLADPSTGLPVTQVDTMPRAYTYPTGMWAPGEAVSDEIVLSLAGIPPGRYELAVGWYEPDNPSRRLPAVDAGGEPLPDDRLVLPGALQIAGD